eukprot:TRINITY_DN1559_c0_g1_i1.p1 TRINITY_DN1559_c0_g1~~TRINITY_DN1559_c0_g1_i1.p1  ORF type:complete len:627 (-),score=202.43 TRINITY_DN1559_c0_g1_i1:213-2093(-)
MASEVLNGEDGNSDGRYLIINDASILMRKGSITKAHKLLGNESSKVAKLLGPEVTSTLDNGFTKRHSREERNRQSLGVPPEKAVKPSKSDTNVELEYPLSDPEGRLGLSPRGGRKQNFNSSYSSYSPPPVPNNTPNFSVSFNENSLNRRKPSTPSIGFTESPSVEASPRSRVVFSDGEGDKPTKELRSLIKNKRQKSVINLKETEDRLEKLDFKHIMNHMEPQNVVDILNSMMMEKKILFVASAVILNSCLESFIALLWPFEWAHAYVPILPSSQSQAFISKCLTPFLAGVTKESLESKIFLNYPPEVIVVDVEANKITWGNEKIPAYPSKVNLALLDAVHSFYGKSDAVKEENIKRQTITDLVLPDGMNLPQVQPKISSFKLVRSGRGWTMERDGGEEGEGNQVKNKVEETKSRLMRKRIMTVWAALFWNYREFMEDTPENSEKKRRYRGFKHEEYLLTFPRKYKHFLKRFIKTGMWGWFIGGRKEFVDQFDQLAEDSKKIVAHLKSIQLSEEEERVRQMTVASQEAGVVLESLEKQISEILTKSSIKNGQEAIILGAMMRSFLQCVSKGQNEDGQEYIRESASSVTEWANNTRNNIGNSKSKAEADSSIKAMKNLSSLLSRLNV